MKYYVDKSAGRSAYLQIYEQLRADIVSGVLPEGARLPSKRQIASELGVSVITAEHAYALLVDGGYAEAREKSGYYSAFGGVSGRRGAGGTAEDIAPVPPEDFPFSALAKTMRKVLSERGEQILVKSPNCGCGELREAISGYLARSRGVLVGPEQIIIGSGAEYIYGLVVQLLGRSSVFALEEPSYEKIRQVYEANGVSCEGLALGRDGIDTALLDKCRARALHITPYRSFPSGITAGAAKRHEYVRWAQKNGAYIIEDDYESEFSAPTRQVETIFSIDPERVIYVNTFSRTLAPAMRMGYMVLPEALLREYTERLGFYSCTVPVFEQYVLAEFIESGSFERCINRRRRKMRQGT